MLSSESARGHDTSIDAVQAALAELKKGTEEVNPDEESLQRLKALRGEGPTDQPAAKAKPAFRTAQVITHCPSACVVLHVTTRSMR